jgi:hypothetical protein
VYDSNGRLIGEVVPNDPPAGLVELPAKPR